MIVELGNLHARVIQHTARETRWLSDYLAFPDEKARFRKLPPWKRGDGMLRMLSEATMTFPAGFRDAVAKQAAVDGIKVEWVDKRKPPAQVSPDPNVDVSWLRDYQLEALRTGKERGVFHHVTGAGKTMVMAALCAQYNQLRWGVFTHDKTLLSQTADRFEKRIGEEVGFIGDGAVAPKRITAAMFQTAYRRLLARDKRMLDWLCSLDGILVDECHIVPAATFLHVVMATPNAYFRYGFSATPFARGDKKSIFTWGALGPVIHRVTAQRLIDAGLLAKPKIKMVPVRQKCTGSTWASVYSEAIVRSSARNSVLVSIARVAAKPCFLFVQRIEHGRILERALRAAGEKVEFVWGQHETAQRKAAIRRLVHGDTDILICNVVFQHGIDVPELQSVIIGSGGKSVIAALQDIGRGTRRHDSAGRVTKTEFDVWDIADKGCGCASPSKHLGCKWLERHTRGRLAAYSIEKFDVAEVAQVVDNRVRSMQNDRQQVHGTHDGRAG